MKNKIELSVECRFTRGQTVYGMLNNCIREAIVEQVYIEKRFKSDDRDEELPVSVSYYIGTPWHETIREPQTIGKFFDDKTVLIAHLLRE